LLARLFLTTTLGLVATATAHAQDENRARMHFQAGASYYEAGEYEDALREFQRAYDLSNKPELFYNFSLSYQQLGDLENAIEYLRRYLAEVENVPNRGNLERRLENFEERLAEQRAREQTPQQEQTPPDTEPIEPGPAEPPPSEEMTFGSSAPEPEIDDTEGGGLSGLTVVGLVTAGVGVVTMATFGILALGEESSVADGCGATTSCTEDDVSTMDTFALLSDIGLGVAVVGGALAVVGLVTGGGDDPATDTASVSPWIAPEGAGASLRGAF